MFSFPTVWKGNTKETAQAWQGTITKRASKTEYSTNPNLEDTLLNELLREGKQSTDIFANNLAVHLDIRIQYNRCCVHLFSKRMEQERGRYIVWKQMPI